MDDLIKALMIFRKYGNPSSPTNCTNDMLSVMIDPDLVSDEDTAELARLGFDPADEGMFYSFVFGSA